MSDATAKPLWTSPARLVVSMLDKPWTRLLLYWLLIGGASIGAGTALWFGSIATRAQSFSTAEGTVVRSELKQRPQSKLLPVIAVRYTVAERSYTTKLIPAQGIEGDADLSYEQVVARHPVGTRVPVFYDPAAPNRAVLNRAPRTGRLWGAVAVLLVALAFVVGVDRKRSARVAPVEAAATEEAQVAARRSAEVASRSALGFGLAGVVLWPFALVAWQRRATALIHYAEAAISPSLSTRIVAVLAPLGLTLPLLLIPLMVWTKGYV